MDLAPKNPTTLCYGDLTWLYDHYNGHLFDRALPPCLLTLQRKGRRVYGYFRPKSFRHAQDLADEIALNPEHFVEHKRTEIFQTLVHEMVHLWQNRFGTPGRRGYHNREWARKMEAIGLMPSDTGKPGGKKTGERMADYVIEGGKFEQVTAAVADRWSLWIHQTPDAGAAGVVGGAGEAFGAGAKATRRKYRCACGKNLWAKPGLAVLCVSCGQGFQML